MDLSRQNYKALPGLTFKIYSPNQKLAFGWKCSVNDVMKLSPLLCCDLSQNVRVVKERKSRREREREEKKSQINRNKLSLVVLCVVAVARDHPQSFSM